MFWRQPLLSKNQDFRSDGDKIGNECSQINLWFSTYMTGLYESPHQNNTFKAMKDGSAHQKLFRQIGHSNNRNDGEQRVEYCSDQSNLHAFDA